VPAVYGSLGRFGFGSLGLLVVLLFYRPWPALTAPLFWRLSAMGLFGVFFYNICFFNGLQTVPAGRASLVASMQPMFVFLFSALVWGEKVTPLKIGGLLVSLAGAVLVLSQGEPGRLFAQGLNSGDLWILGCAVSWVVYTLLGRTVMGKMPAVAATAYSTWIGTLGLVGYAALQPVPEAPWSATVWLASAFLGLGGTTLAFLLYLKGIGQIGPSRASIFINLVPVFGVVLSSLFLGEAISGATLLGGAIVIAGVRMLNR
jgi:drug/metabolite transporter (DMT)-like permease